MTKDYSINFGLVYESCKKRSFFYFNKVNKIRFLVRNRSGNRTPKMVTGTLSEVLNQKNFDVFIFSFERKGYFKLNVHFN